MAQVALQYAVGSILSDCFEDFRVVGSEIILDVDASETPYTADYTITAHDQAIAFIVCDPATAGTLTARLYHGTTHAAQLDTNAIYQGGSDGVNAPAATVVLDMTKAADRNAVIMVNPGATDADGVGADKYLGKDKKVSLGFTSNASHSDGQSVIVVCVAGKLRNSPALSAV